MNHPGPSSKSPTAAVWAVVGCFAVVLGWAYWITLPLPYTLEVWLARPLQSIATVAATYTLQTVGYPAVAEGNVIHINDQRIGVLEACNGLGMLVAFFALSTAVAIILDRRPWLDR